MSYQVTYQPTDKSRKGAINECKGVILHSEPINMARFIDRMKDLSGRTSYHVFIGADGSRLQMADDSKVTWHSGSSEWKGKSDCNAWCLGVVFEGGTKGTKITQDQISSFLEWLQPKAQAYGWKASDITDHKRVAIPKGRVKDIPDDDLNSIVFQFSQTIINLKS